MRLPGGGTRRHACPACTAASPAPPTPAPDGRLRVEVEERPDEEPPRVQTAELEREYRAVVEEILELRDADPRIREFVRAISGAGALADTSAYAPDISFADKVRAARDDRRRRAARAVAAPAARAARRAAGAPPHPRGRRVRRPEAAARVHPAPPDGVDPQGARRGRRLGRRRTTARSSPSASCRTTSASRPSARSHGSSGWATRPASRR